jgi:hypothetical protein
MDRKVRPHGQSSGAVNFDDSGPAPRGPLMKCLKKACALTMQYLRLAPVALKLIVFALVTPGNFDEADTLRSQFFSSASR